MVNINVQKKIISVLDSWTAFKNILDFSKISKEIVLPLYKVFFNSRLGSDGLIAQNLKSVVQEVDGLGDTQPSSYFEGGNFKTGKNWSSFKGEIDGLINQVAILVNTRRENNNKTMTLSERVEFDKKLIIPLQFLICLRDFVRKKEDSNYSVSRLNSDVTNLISLAYKDLDPDLYNLRLPGFIIRRMVNFDRNNRDNWVTSFAIKDGYGDSSLNFKPKEMGGGGDCFWHSLRYALEVPGENWVKDFIKVQFHYSDYTDTLESNFFKSLDKNKVMNALREHSQRLARVYDVLESLQLDGANGIKVLALAEFSSVYRFDARTLGDAAKNIFFLEALAERAGNDLRNESKFIAEMCKSFTDPVNFVVGLNTLALKFLAVQEALKSGEDNEIKKAARVGGLSDSELTSSNIAGILNLEIVKEILVQMMVDPKPSIGGDLDKLSKSLDTLKLFKNTFNEYNALQDRFENKVFIPAGYTLSSKVIAIIEENNSQEIGNRALIKKKFGEFADISTIVRSNLAFQDFLAQLWGKVEEYYSKVDTSSGNVVIPSSSELATVLGEIPKIAEGGCKFLINGLINGLRIVEQRDWERVVRSAEAQLMHVIGQLYSVWNREDENYSFQNFITDIKDNEIRAELVKKINPQLAEKANYFVDMLKKAQTIAPIVDAFKAPAEETGIYLFKQFFGISGSEVDRDVIADQIVAKIKILLGAMSQTSDIAVLDLNREVDAWNNLNRKTDENFLKLMREGMSAWLRLEPDHLLSTYVDEMTVGTGTVKGSTEKITWATDGEVLMYYRLGVRCLMENRGKLLDFSLSKYYPVTVNHILIYTTDGRSHFQALEKMV